MLLWGDFPYFLPRRHEEVRRNGSKVREIPSLTVDTKICALVGRTHKELYFCSGDKGKCLIFHSFLVPVTMVTSTESISPVRKQTGKNKLREVLTPHLSVHRWSIETYRILKALKKITWSIEFAPIIFIKFFLTSYFIFCLSIDLCLSQTCLNPLNIDWRTTSVGHLFQASTAFSIKL